jgi:hypothetical protein
VAWSPPAGAQPDFAYHAGQSAAGLLTDPVAVANFFSFFPTAMQLTAVNGSSVSVNDSASVNLLANPGTSIARVSVAAVGDYAMLGSASVNVVGTLTVTNLSTLASLSTSLVVAPLMPVVTDSAASGIFSGLAHLHLPVGWSEVNVEYNLTPSADSQPGGVAFIDVKVAQISATTVVPEPAALLLLPAWVMMARRR